MNIIFYGALFAFSEFGCFKKLIHNFILKIILKETVNKNHEKTTENSDLTNISKDKVNSLESNENFINNESDKENMQNKSNLLNNKNNKDNTNLQREIYLKINGLIEIFYCCKRKKKKIINKLNLELHLNEKIGLLGDNGTGKTILFKTIINEILYDKSSITLFGYDISKKFDIINSKIGYCPQINIDFDYMKVKEIIQFFSNLNSHEIDVKSFCKNFNLENYLDTDYNNLSFGNKRKLILAITLINNPKLLLLDNPFNSIDYDSKQIIIDYINKLFNNGYECNMLISNYSFEEESELCDRFYSFDSSGLKQDKNIKNKKDNEYKLIIKFSSSIINIDETISTEKIQETYNKIKKIVRHNINVDEESILNNTKIEPCLNALLYIINNILKYINNIKLNKNENDLTYKLNINMVSNEHKKIVYLELLKMKYVDKNISKKISEIIILKVK